jgi:hypothetical protein
MWTCSHLGNISFPGNERCLDGGASSYVVDPILSATNEI